MDIRQAKAILEKYRTGNCSTEEKEMVEKWYARLVDTGEWEWSDGEAEQLEQAMEEKLLLQIKPTEQHHSRKYFIQRASRWWAAAAILLLLAAVTLFFFYGARHNNQHSLSQVQRFKNDILPATQQVVLTLSDGTQQALDDVSNGTVTHQGLAEAVKKDSSMIYNSPGNTSEEAVVYNTIATGKGRTFHLQLSDGSEVWLDALSSIRFPTSFPGGERIVEITGQVYFEVAHNAKKSFKVKSGKQVTEVLGTHFNINSFNGEKIQTTLLEGRLRVQSLASANSGMMDPHAVIISPGQQSIFSPANAQLTTLELQDTDEVMAWKDGRFRFDGSSVKEITDQLSRWYNIDVVYKDTITETFVADIKRDVPISKMLKLLEMTKQIKFVIEGNKVIVMKY
ncbi:FecR family protein [Chitinophaga eiseniae]|uniref:FecR family protein n=1 Tax=Chitinophaga eiseniae TaxID=634771 RepID=A0A847STH0_9BACT|nr:FecR family protein [Chitinophaga eiseniae]NLR79662.1 FecR family protein [Chitinophaga eiseniae]